MLFPDCTKIVFAADATGKPKARLKPGVAARDIKRGKARKISDNFIQYYCYWPHKKPISLGDAEIVLLSTVSRYTKKPGWLIANEDTVKNIFLHNEQVVRLAMPGLESIPLGDPKSVTDIFFIYNNFPTVPFIKAKHDIILPK
ncbi:MAG: hypothetical protein A4E53_00384 [Pelotomaculum sp. PtaB.Bin104]|nr:MAG: hypothetical protein A4E53_00384 [Pelotomaculum sp. PtaB.Bin104]